MTFLHFRHRDRLGLLASGALAADEARSVENHVATCVACQGELSDLKRVDALLRADAAAGRDLPISSEALRTRVFARIKEAPRPVSVPTWNFGAGLAAIGLVGVGLLLGILGTSFRPADPGFATQASGGATAQGTPVETAFNSAAFYEKLEKTQLRANAARYLAEAQDILVHVRDAADCPESKEDSVDVAREAQTSRTLLKRRAALVSGSGETLLAARGVMEEVEGMLQQVADLPQCTRRSDVDAIARKVDRRNLLMKIDMVAQELAAP